MEKILDYLYSRFLLRDLLAKVFPGFISLIAIISILNRMPLRILQLFSIIPDLALIFIVYSVSFIAGMLLQYLVMSIGLSIIHVWPPQDEFPRTDLSLLMAHKFVMGAKSNDHLARVRERYTVLKEMSGNFAGALSILLISLLIRYFLFGSPDLKALYIIVPSLGVLIYLLIKQNRYHAKEQRLWEFYTLPYPQK